MAAQRRPKERKLAHERGMSAWLITWEEHPPGKRLAARERVVVILDPRMSSESVKTILEALHNSTEYTLSEQAGFANRRKFDPYPAEYTPFDGTVFQGRMTCGHNPYLYARLVDKLRIVGSPGEEEVTWTDRPLPETLKQRLERRAKASQSRGE